jgi:hypothetical protein
MPRQSALVTQAQIVSPDVEWLGWLLPASSAARVYYSVAAIINVPALLFTVS